LAGAYTTQARFDEWLLFEPVEPDCTEPIHIGVGGIALSAEESGEPVLIASHTHEIWYEPGDTAAPMAITTPVVTYATDPEGLLDVEIPDTTEPGTYTVWSQAGVEEQGTALLSPDTQ
jgi:hypothetical protein